jgi:hypothetical protein
LAKQLMDRDPTIGSERAAKNLRALIDSPADRSRQLKLGTVAVVIGVGGALLLMVTMFGSAPRLPVTGPEVQIGGSVIRVGYEGQVAVLHPGDGCVDGKLYLLDPDTSQVWTFETFESGTSGAPLVIVPGATELGLSETTGGCFSVIAHGPAGEVALP